MFLNVKKMCENIILIAILTATMLALAIADCDLYIPKDISLRPKVALKIGSHQVELESNENENTRTVPFFENQEIELSCRSEFAYPEIFKGKRITILTLICENGYLYTLNRDDYFKKQEFVCSAQKWNLYEQVYGFAWCSSNMTSYILARPIHLEATRFEYLAGICYDISKLSIKSVYFTIGPKHAENLHPRAISDRNTPMLELKHFKETFGKRSVRKNDYDNTNFKDWIEYSQYNYSSIIQNSLLLNEFDEQLGSILDFVWWPNLRLGNWKRYERALARQVESQNQSYDIMAGVSAVVTVPIIENCQTNFTLKELIDYRNGEIPLYVWNYLQSPNNSSDEVVIIGFNSPFYEFYAEKDVIFCPDICQEIPWLEKVSSTFRYDALGVMFCCSIEDVKSSKRLDGFPDIDVTLKPEDDVTVRPNEKLTRFYSQFV